MKKGCLVIGGVVLGIIIFLVIIMGFWGVSKRNSFVPLQEGAKSQWANVENVYQRRADLIPNLVNTVKGYATHEEKTLTEVIEARAKATQTTIDPTKLTDDNIAAFQKAQDGLSGALSRLMVSVEQYPDLKANQNFLDLQSQLEGTENRIAVERRTFNEKAQAYNTAISLFPANLIANFSGFQPMGYFKAAEGSDKAPAVQF